MGFLIADNLGYFNCASPRSTFNHVSLFFIAIHRILPLSPVFRKFCNKFYPVFHICIYSDLLKSLSLWVTNRKDLFYKVCWEAQRGAEPCPNHTAKTGGPGQEPSLLWSQCLCVSPVDPSGGWELAKSPAWSNLRAGLCWPTPGPSAQLAPDCESPLSATTLPEL